MWPSRRSLPPVIGLALVGGPLALALGSSACDEAYEPACRVTARRVLASDPTIAGRPTSALVRSRDRAVAWWTRREVLDPGSGSDAGAAGGLQLTAFEVAVVDELGMTSTRATVPAPEALRARKASVEDVGVVPVEGAFVVHWTETTATTDPDGRVRTASAVRASRVSDGVAAEPATVFACQQCVTAAAFFPVAGGATALVRIDPDHLADVLGAPVQTRFAALGIRADGTVHERQAPWLVVPPRATPDGGLGSLGAASAPGIRGDLTVEIDADGHVEIVASRRSWLADEELHLLAGPLALPSAADAHVSWQTTGEAAIAWSLSPFEDGRSGDQFAPREVFTGIAPAGAPALVSRERTSRGTRTLAFDRRGDDLGVLFESVGRTFFASIEPRGKKRGGDLLLASAPTSGGQAASDARSHVVIARADHRFTVVALGAGELVATEVTCEP